MEGVALSALVDGWWVWLGRVSGAAVVLVATAELLQRSRLIRSPEVRSWLWRIVYAKLALLLLLPVPIPLALVLLPELEVGRAASLPPPVSSPPSGEPFLAGGSSPAPAFPAVAAPGPGARPTLSGGRAAWCVLWLAGIAVATWRLVGAHRAVRRCVRESEAVEDTILRRWLPDVSVSDADAATPHVRVRWSRRPLASPMVVGLRRPVILLPDPERLALSDSEMRFVLAHELGHVRRRDLAWMTLRRWVNVVLFFHPFVRWSERQAGLADEIACDGAAVVESGARGSEYGRLLLRVSEAGGWGRGFEPLPGGVGLGPAGRRLAERLRALAVRGRRVGRREATVWTLLAAAVLVSGAFTVHARRSIRQLDPTYRVTGFLVSLGAGHGVSVTRERCQWMGLHLSQVTQRGLEDTVGGAPAAAAGPSWPRRVAGWLGAAGLDPKFETEFYGVQVYDGEAGCAVLVRFAAGDGAPPVEAIAGELVDEDGESIPLPARALGGGGGEFVRAWSLSPAPVTPAKFQLRLTLPESGRELARLRLGTIGGRPAGGS